MTSIIDESILHKIQSLGAPHAQREPSKLVKHSFCQTEYTVSLPVTFTPFASAKSCSARCTFCSESLLFKEVTRLSASLRPQTGYFDGLRQALCELSGLPFGLSLSGLESTDDPDWLERVLSELDLFELTTPISEKVLYTNTSGLAANTYGNRLIPRLAAFGLTRVEVSRHHFNGSINNQIMRFRHSEVRDQNVFEETICKLLNSLHVRLVCVVQSSGIASFADVISYLEWAKKLGVRDVVFREFSKTHELYLSNSTLRTIEETRVPLESLLLPIIESKNSDFVLCETRTGYYYWNARYLWKNAVSVTFETSDYKLMKELHNSQIIYKLIYHANGNLTADWDPDSCILLKTSH